MAMTPTHAATHAPTPHTVAWRSFAERLAGVLDLLVEDQYLVIPVKRTNRFVQFAAQGAVGMRAEISSNSYLPHSQRLNSKQIAALVAAGWHGPTGTPDAATPEKDPEGPPNFFIDYPVPVPFAKVAELTVDTLAAILRVQHPGLLEYKAFDAEGNPIELPTLGIKCINDPVRTDDENATRWTDRLLTTLREPRSIDEEHDNEFGCAECWSDVADQAWGKLTSLSIEKELVDESHFMVKIRCCPACSQRFVTVFTEVIDWYDGEDDQSWTVLPISLSQARLWPI
jgi:hypothetical protein